MSVALYFLLVNRFKIRLLEFATCFRIMLLEVFYYERIWLGSFFNLNEEYKSNES